MHTPSPKSPWIVRHHPVASPALRLFCLPFAGGSAAAYRTWGPALAPRVEVCAVELPGRGARFTESPLRDAPSVINALRGAVAGLLDRPYALFGHSMGAVLAFELARALRRAGDPAPALLVASGHRAPHQERPEDERVHALPEREFIARLRKLNGTPREFFDQPELVELFLPVLRADFALVETYAHAPESPLSAPILAVGGAADPDVRPEQLAAWREHTSGTFTATTLPGDHFYLRESEPALLAAIARALAPAAQNR